MMDDGFLPADIFQFQPASCVQSSPLNSMRLLPSAPLDRARYVAELFAERQKLEPFVQVLPFCSKLLNQEILRASGFSPTQSFLDPKVMDHGSPLRFSGHHLNGGIMDVEGWSAMQMEDNGIQETGNFQASPMGWHGAPRVSTGPAVKKVIRLDVPVDKFPNYNFVGRLLGPRGNSLKRVEATTQCRVYIRGRGSVKDSIKEEKLRDKPGYEHLNEPLHVLVEAEFPPDMIDTQLNKAVGILEDLLKPVDESLDYYKKQQLRELALINGTLREESPQMSPSVSPFNSTAIKRVKSEDW